MARGLFAVLLLADAKCAMLEFAASEVWQFGKCANPMAIGPGCAHSLLAREYLPRVGYFAARRREWLAQSGADYILAGFFQRQLYRLQLGTSKSGDDGNGAEGRSQLGRSSSLGEFAMDAIMQHDHSLDASSLLGTFLRGHRWNGIYGQNWWGGSGANDTAACARDRARSASGRSSWECFFSPRFIGNVRNGDTLKNTRAVTDANIKDQSSELWELRNNLMGAANGGRLGTLWMAAQLAYYMWAPRPYIRALADAHHTNPFDPRTTFQITSSQPFTVGLHVRRGDACSCSRTNCTFSSDWRVCVPFDRYVPVLRHVQRLYHSIDTSTSSVKNSSSGKRMRVLLVTDAEAELRHASHYQDEFDFVAVPEHIAGRRQLSVGVEAPCDDRLFVDGVVVGHSGTACDDAKARYERNSFIENRIAPDGNSVTADGSISHMATRQQLDGRKATISAIVELELLSRADILIGSIFSNFMAFAVLLAYGRRGYFPPLAFLDKNIEATFELALCTCAHDEGGAPVLPTAEQKLDNNYVNTCARVDDNLPEGPESRPARLRCPQNQRIVRVDFASFGVPGGTCSPTAFLSATGASHGFHRDICHASNSQEVAERLCIGRQACTVPADRDLFYEPCAGLSHHLATDYLAIAVTCGT